MPLPFLAAGAAILRRAAPAAARLAGRALRTITKGKLIGSGGGREALRTAGRAAGGIITAGATVAAGREVVRSVRPQPLQLGPGSELAGMEGGRIGKRYRRMNPANGRALRRAMRRLDAAENIFKKVFKFNHGRAPTNVRLKGGR
jgi:hypothetical protein